jgi:PucR family transcriptional regulator, purine catabolism regulatory protein
MTVDELRRQVLPPGTEVIAGALGADREVTWAATLRTRPPAFPHLKGGEIALISTEAMRVLETSLQLATLVRSLAGRAVSAVAVLGEVSPETRELADSIGLPVLLLPPGSHLADLEQAIARAVVDHRTIVHQRGQEIYRRLTELAIESRGVEAILETLADVTGKSVVLEEGDFQLRSCITRTESGCDPAALRRLPDDAPRIGSWLERATLAPAEPPTLRLPLGDAHSRVLAPIVVREAVLGYLSVVGERGSLTEVDDLAASRGAAACAIEMARERAVHEAEDRLQTDLVEALTSGSYPSPDAVLTRAERLGFDLGGPQSVVVFQVAADEPGRAPRSSLTARRLEGVLEREVAARGLRAPTGVRGDRVVLVVPSVDLDATQMRSVAVELRDALASQVEAPVSAGVGRPYGGLEGIPRSYEEADGALALGARFLGRGQVAHFAELGLYRLLLALRATDELDSFFDQTLGSLVEYDRKNDGELVKTLDAYFAALGSPTDAAERLHVHRNTLLYRLNRIQEIAGVDLGDAETRLALHLALRVRDVLQTGDRTASSVRSAQSAVR